ncbi:MAG: diguanylate cyclase [Planctomycetota bacterium]
MSQLIILEGPNIGDCFELSASQTVGSDSSSTIQLKDRRLSGTQLRILKEGKQITIHNLDPSKVLTVNGEVLMRGVLQHGDIISLCNTLMLYAEDEHPKEKASLEDEISMEHSKIFTRKPVPMEDSQLFNQEENFSAKLYTLYQIGSIILEHSDKKELCFGVLKIIYQEFKFHRGVIFLYDEGGPRLKQIAAFKNGEKYLKIIEYSQTIIDFVAKNQESVLSKNAQKDARFLSKRSIADLQIDSCISVPITFKGKLLGIIHIDSPDSHTAYTNADLDQLTKIGTQVGLALENIQNQLTLIESTRILKSLNKASQWLSSNLDKANIIKEASGFASTNLKCQRVSFLILEEGASIATLSFSFGIKRDLWPKIQVPLGEQLVGKAIQENLPILYPSASPNSLLKNWNLDPNRGYRTNSFIIVPVSIKDSSTGKLNRVGAICVTDKMNQSDFTESDLEHLQILASQTGISFKNADLYEKATVDVLTRIYVRQYFFIKLEELFEESEPFSLLLLDLDHFKSVNDRYGHPAGDEILRETGTLLKQVVGTRGVCCRYGGEEFAILLPHFDSSGAQEIAQQINSTFRNFVFNARSQAPLHCTISIGISSHKAKDTPELLISKADRALYQTKDKGRDQFTVWDEDV